MSASGRYVNQPGTACSAGHSPVASDVSAGAVDDGATVRSSITVCDARKLPAGCRSTISMPSPSTSTKTTCSAGPIASAMRAALPARRCPPAVGIGGKGMGEIDEIRLVRVGQ